MMMHRAEETVMSINLQTSRPGFLTIEMLHYCLISI